MNGFQYAVAAWLPIVIFPQTMAPDFRELWFQLLRFSNARLHLSCRIRISDHVWACHCSDYRCHRYSTSRTSVSLHSQYNGLGVVFTQCIGFCFDVPFTFFFFSRGRTLTLRLVATGWCALFGVIFHYITLGYMIGLSGLWEVDVQTWTAL